MGAWFRWMLRTTLAGSLLFGGVLSASVIGGTLPASATGTYSASNQQFGVLSSGAHPVVPRFAIRRHSGPASPVGSVSTSWTFSYSYLGTTYNETFIGTDPASSAKGTATTVPVVIIPVKLVSGTFTADPMAKMANKKTAVAETVKSPIFKKSVDFVQGGTNIGKTQYIDAFQRASLWGTVTSHPKYHVLLGNPLVEPEQTLTVPAAYGSVGTPFGIPVIEADINWYDNSILPMLSGLGVPTNALPIFVRTQSYLYDNTGCCIGGYHSTTISNQPYADFTYIQSATTTFSEDVSALSHEIGEYVDDPFVNNYSSLCGIYEVGDPLEGTANFGNYPYAVGGFTYHLQDLVMPPYFGALSSTSVNGWSTFQGTPLSVCQNGA